MKFFGSQPKGIAKSNYRQVIIDFNKSCRFIHHKNRLIDSMLARTTEVLSTNSIYYFDENEANGRLERYVNRTSAPDDLYFEHDSKFLQWLTSNEIYISHRNKGLTDIYSEREQGMMRIIQPTLILPITINDCVKGVFIVGKKKWNRRYTVQQIDVITILLASFETALENLSYVNERQLHLKSILQNERLAVVGELAAGTAHEIRNPLTSIRSIMQYVQKDIPENHKELVDMVISEVDRINKIVCGLLTYSRQQNPTKEVFDLKAVLETAVKLLSKGREPKKITFGIETSLSEAMMWADQNQISQVMMNLLLNAIDAIENEGEIKIHLAQYNQDNQNMYRIIFHDTGCGIKPDDLDRIFNPFYTTKQDGNGLGLSVIHGIVERHDGSIKVESEPSKGTRFTLDLPSYY